MQAKRPGSDSFEDVRIQRNGIINGVIFNEVSMDSVAIYPEYQCEIKIPIRIIK